MSARHAFVTGAGTGIGRAIALALADKGSAVSLAGRRAGPLQAVAAEIAALGGKALVVDGFDVTDEQVVATGAAQAISKLGEVSVLVNCAGEAPSAPFEKTDPVLWNHVVAINLTGTYLVTRTLLPSLRKAGRASSTSPAPPA